MNSSVWFMGCLTILLLLGTADQAEATPKGSKLFASKRVAIAKKRVASAKKRIASASKRIASANKRKTRRKKRKGRRKKVSKRAAVPAPALVPTAPPQPVDPLASFRNRVLIIATKSSPPFSMKEGNGRWTGISIELWKEIARTLRLKYKFQEMTLSEMLQATRTGKADAAVASLTITPQREEFLDFTHSFYSTGLGIAVPFQQSSSQLMAIIKKFFTWEYISFFLILLGFLWVTGVLVWFFERKANPDQFGGRISHGIGAGFWWSVVTMTTVGYGDKSPQTFLGRVVAIFWIFAGLILVSTFTATLTTLLTVSRLESGITGPKDLYKLKVATVERSTSMRYLQSRRISFLPEKTVYDGMRAVADKKADAMVYDAPLLRYIAAHQLNGVLRVLPEVFERQDYGIALTDKSPLREPINRILLRFIYSERWNGMLQRYMGK